MNGRQRLIVTIGLTAMTCLFAAGCGQQTATVEGKVSYKGKPVTNGSVIVYCSDKQIVRGNLDKDGRYSIPNVPYGSLAVTVQARDRMPTGLRMQQTLPPSTGGPIQPTVEQSDTSRPTIPQRYTLPEESGLAVVVDRGTVAYDIELVDRNP